MTTRKAIASRQWINKDGKECAEEEATGFNYTLLDSKDRPFVYQLGLPAGQPSTMLAIFGGLTLAGNMVNSAKDDEDPLLAVKERFDLIDSGTWVSREGGFGPRYDADTLAAAIAAVKGGEVATYRAKMGTEIEVGGKKVRYETAAMRIEAVKTKYQELKPPKAVEVPSIETL